jgi:hypothetical protein
MSPTSRTITSATIILALTIVSWANFKPAYTQSPTPNSASCPPGQVAVVNNGKPVINNQTHSIMCTPIDALGASLGR